MYLLLVILMVIAAILMCFIVLIQNSKVCSFAYTHNLVR